MNMSMPNLGTPQSMPSSYKLNLNTQLFGLRGKQNNF